MAFYRSNSALSTPTIVIGGSERGGAGFTSTIITGSGVLQIGDVVATTTQAAGNGIVMRRYNAAGDKIVGVCIGFGRANGKTVVTDAGTTDTVTVASDNETNAQIFALIDVTPNAVWSASITGTIHATAIFGLGAQVEGGTTTGAGNLTESTVTRTASAHLGWACIGPDPLKTTRGLVICVEGLFRGQQTAS